MAQVRIRAAGTNFRANRAERRVISLLYLGACQGPRETGPSTTRIELVQRTEQRFARDNVHVDAGFPVIPESIAEWWFSATLLSDFVLHRIEVFL